MYFRNLIFSALVLAVVVAAILSAYQAFFITPIIIHSEQYEMAAVAADSQADSNSVWAPEDGIERLGWNFSNNFLLCFGFALILLSAMSLQASVTWLKGLCWGGAAYLAVFALPSLGLPPEIPGLQAGYLPARQVWWLYTVLATALSLWLIAYQQVIYKVLAVLLLASPHIIGAPQPRTHGFVNTNAAAGEALTSLWHQFIIQTSIANLVLWLVMGVGAGLLLNKYIQPSLKK